MNVIYRVSFMLSVTNKSILLSVVMLSVIVLSIIMLIVIMLSIIMLSIIMLTVVMPLDPFPQHNIFFVTYKWS